MKKPIYHLTLKEMAPDSRPRERLIKSGSSNLSNAEILAILLRTGTSTETALQLAEGILNEKKGLCFLAESSIEELTQIRGIGPAKSAQIKAAIELGRRLSLASREGRAAIRSPAEAANMMLEEMRYLDREYFKVVLLNTKNYVMSVDLVSVGSLNASLVHAREVFKKAIIQSAAGIILVHNHPSGDPMPSEEDKNITLRMVEAGKIVGIEVLDHVIIGDGKYISLKEEQIL